MTDNKSMKQNVNTAEDTAQKAMTEAKDKTQQKLNETTNAAKEQAKRVADKVGEQAKMTVESRKSSVAEELGSVADVVRQTAYETGAGTNPAITDYGRRIADQIEGVSDYLNQKGTDDILADIQDFAHRQPVVFLGGAFMLGLMVGRFVNSSAERRTSMNDGIQGQYRSDFPTTGYRDEGYSRTGTGGRTTSTTSTTRSGATRSSGSYKD